MSTQQGHNTANNHSNIRDAVPTRRISDHFSSSRSYAADYHAQNLIMTQRRVCEQLREEAQRERTKVSVVCKDLVRYVTDHQSTDALVTGFQSPKDNPFRDKQQCSLL